MNTLLILASILSIIFLGSAHSNNVTTLETRITDPICYNCDYGPSGAVMDQAIEWFCSKYDNVRINHWNDDGGVLAVSDTLYVLLHGLTSVSERLC